MEARSLSSEKTESSEIQDTEKKQGAKRAKKTSEEPTIINDEQKPQDNKDSASETTETKKRHYVRKKKPENAAENKETAKITEAAASPSETRKSQTDEKKKNPRTRTRKKTEEATGTLFPQEPSETAETVETEKKPEISKTEKTVRLPRKGRGSRKPSVSEAEETAATSYNEVTEPEKQTVETEAVEIAAAVPVIIPTPEEEIQLETQALEGAELIDEAEEETEAESAEETKTVTFKSSKNKAQTRHQHPKLSFNQLEGQTLFELRKIAKEMGVASITARRKDVLVNDILKTQAEALGYRFNGGTLECMAEGYGFLRPSGLLPSNSDIYVSASQIRRFGLRNGDVAWGVIRPPKDQEHYEALLRVENVNFTDPEEARRRPHFEALTPIFPDEQLKLETDRKQIATRIVDIFAPIGKGQRALIVSPPKAGKTTLLKNLAHSITTNNPEVILMVLLIDERPEEVTDMARSVDGEIIASTFDRPAEEHLRVAQLALEKAKRLVEVNKDVVVLLDSITRLARASNLTVPPSGRTLSGGMDPAALYFPKKFFGAARNIENGGSLTIIGTSLVETGSRMDDVIYEEFKGTGNMEVHLSRKISEQRIFPALDITKSGTRKEELMIPEADLQRIWGLRRKIANMDEAEVLNLILDKLRNTPTNRDFLATIKV